MGIFDNPKGQATFSFSALPESGEQLRALPEAAMTTPFQTAALTVCALCAYAAAPDVGIELLNDLRGPRPIKLRRNGDDQWCLWEQYLLTDIRSPKAAAPWA